MQMSTPTRKKRNFVLQERYLLLEIIKSYKQVVENKKTDSVSAATKKYTWAKIAEKYNSSAIVTEPATGEQLRRLWQNLKTRQREALTKEHRYRSSIGDGDPCPDTEVDQHEQIAESTVGDFSCSEKKIRVQILRKEFMNRERRAEALHNLELQLHNLQLQFLKEKHELEMKTLAQNLREAQAKADAAQK